ncbi:SH3 domain-containing C40 family peptidase [Dethiosulfovibrio salsuginis]|uniref:NlpC/P60 family protein n=1 Tax=Dethiosulfovibrio salsuginis TaxID=561720 RepID=A0A1X7KIW8_9BACT|nr:SH3 domain-containing C40 family peptidase [Dethiosulfovibrio salsuginis]SMG41160.1 NlpC/P60 family protein [Dethiosulfovibrio salsuginis]
MRYPLKSTILLLWLALSSSAWALSGVDKIPQSPVFHASSLADLPIMTQEEQRERYDDFKEKFYSPWSQDKSRDGRAVIEWVFGKYGPNRTFGENLKPRSERWISDMKERSNLDQVDSVRSKAIALRPTSLRLMPTDSPVFLSPDLPGEGYPFDYLQNSLVHGGEPLYLSHLSRDGLWAWCDTSYASGWIKAVDLAEVDDLTAQRWMEMDLAAVVKEGTVLRDLRGKALFRAKVGAVLPVKRRGATTLELEVPTGEKGRAVGTAAKVSMEEVIPMPLAATPWKGAFLAEQVLDEPYGWGGFLYNRDCSATTRDLMAPFGIWLPRNSRAQAQTGKAISLEGMRAEDKKRTIVEKGVPFFTLLGQPGHVMLYIGSYRGEPLILHNMWGIRTEENGKEGRFVVGRSVISTLDVGSDLPNHSAGRLIVDRITSMKFP